MRVQKHFCPACGHAAKIRKTNRLNPKMTEQYCSCLDPECGHTYVTRTEVIKTLSPSAKAGQLLLTHLEKILPKHEYQASLDLLQN